MRVTSVRPRHRPSGFFVLRTPLLPIAAWVRDRAALQALVRLPEVREALFVASPALDAGLDAWLDGPETDASRRIERSVARYIGRMATRPTPFGLFAGNSLGALAATTDLTLGPRQAYARRTRLDSDYLSTLCDRLAADPTLRARLRFRPNTSIYRAAGRLRYASRVEGAERSYVLIAAEPTEYLDATLARATAGARIGELAAALATDDITLDEATAYVDELITSQLLVPDLAVRLTGDDPLAELVAQLREAGGALVADTLDRAAVRLRAVDVHGLGNPRARYHELATELAGLPAPVDPARLIQVDLVKPAPQLALNTAVADELLEVIERLRRITAPVTDGPLHRFRDAFAARYEAREVRLVEALDEEVGIGFASVRGLGLDPSPLLDGLPFPGVAQDPSRPWTRQTEHLARRVMRCLGDRDREIVLDQADWDALAVPESITLPDALELSAMIAADGSDAIDRGEYDVLFGGAYGPPGARLLGRFCHADPALHAEVVRHLRAEEACQPEVVFAEIVHLREGRLANISLRPVLREHEIPFLGRSGAAHQLSIEDLYLVMREGRLVLRSASLDREIAPRLTNAHDFDARNLGLYRFLCSLAVQDRMGVGWSFGALDDLPYLPSVRFGRTILALERWKLGAAELAGVTTSGGLEVLRARHRLPRFVGLVEADHVLAIDLENPASVESFKNRPTATLRATWPASDRLPVVGPEGRFTHELVIPLVAPPGPPAPPAVPVVPVVPVRRSFAPGSEWLYAKLYTGEATADRVLVDLVAPLVADAGHWFFIRYHDPASHLRLRVHGDPAWLAGALLPRLHAMAEPLLADGRLWRVQLDTYEREVERYGGPRAIALAEQLFHADSVAVAGIVAALADGDLERRWRIAFRGIDQLLDDLGFELAERLALVESIRDAFAREHRSDVALERAIGERYRRERGALDGLLDPALDRDSEYAPALALLAARSAAQLPIVAALRDTKISLDALAPSLIHMHVNRSVRSSARAHELVLYDLLCRVYRARRARRR